MSRDNRKIADAIGVKIASPEKIISWAPGSRGEVTSPGTLDERTLLPEEHGLFNEVTFGPLNNYQCACGFTKGVRFRGTRCVRCGVEITTSNVRREQMGRITLMTPVAHVWFYRGSSSPISILLEMKQKDLQDVIMYKSYVVLDPGGTDRAKGQVISSDENSDLSWSDTSFRAGTGAGAVRELLEDINLSSEIERVERLLDKKSGGRLEKKLLLLRDFQSSGNRPEWMVLTVLPVLPPDLRPIVVMGPGDIAVSEITNTYKRIISRNNRLKYLVSKGVPEIILQNEKRMLQLAVDSLLDNTKSMAPSISDKTGMPVKSLADTLKGKQGLFRKNLLGKRVDFSARSVIAVGPSLELDQCGLPQDIALELFKPHITGILLSNGTCVSTRHAYSLISAKKDPRVWSALEEVMKTHTVLLNRAPTLHRIGVQAFYPVLVEGNAIRLNPLTCSAFNADFDGDQMGVHLPISEEAQNEAKEIMLSVHNLIKPSDGAPVAVPSQDMILGVYYLTQERPGSKGEGRAFRDMNEAGLAFENKEITFHSRIKVRITNEFGTGITESTYGRFIFNKIVPQDLGFVDRTKDKSALEIDELVGKKQLKKIIQKVLEVHGNDRMAEFLNDVKNMGYRYSTLAALTVSVSDMIIPDCKEDMLKETDQRIATLEKKYRRGLMNEEERYKETISAWMKTDEELTKALLAGMPPTNNLKMMADSGARGSDKQIKQLTGMRGLMADASGRTIELPIKSNFKEGLNVLEYFLSAHGSRKGMSDTALRTADAGYMTRKLVSVAQEITITREDCADKEDDIPFMEVSPIRTKSDNSEKEIETLRTRITGRHLAEKVTTDLNEYPVNHLVTESDAADIAAYKKKTGNEKIKIRTAFTCRCETGICSRCYGINLANHETAQIGDAVGIIAAQSIGEPGTQLPMRTLHTGGVAGGDITQGLPRVAEIFECREPKGKAPIAEWDGVCKRVPVQGRGERYSVTSDTGKTATYFIPQAQTLLVKDGERITAGTPLCTGTISPAELFVACGADAAAAYMLSEVQKVYTSQAVDINDKHIEIILRQLFKYVRITDPGESSFRLGENVPYYTFIRKNKELVDDLFFAPTPAKGKRLLMGLTRTGVKDESFLAAASFQNTAQVLTEAAIAGKIDHLKGIKENVILGNLIPVGRSARAEEEEKIEKEDQEP